MTKRKKIEKEVAVLDFETDPFRFGRVPAPFACGVLWRGVYVDFWGPECWRAAADYLLSIEVPLVVYAHNGGKFDFFFLWPVLENPIKLINARIVSARLGIHELRDSWAIMPFGLATYKKTKIDYAIFEPELREEHKCEILDYLHDDCVDLKALCDAFAARFGFMLTVAGTAMKELVKFHPQADCNETHDSLFRPFYFGGRVECFESGILEDSLKVYDVNSMYPSVMAGADHPLGSKYVSVENQNLGSDGWLPGFEGCLYFASCEGVNRGALPQRSDSGGLCFDGQAGHFETTSHELRTAIALGRFTCTRIVRAWIPYETQRFDAFVQHFTDEKASAKKAGDRITELFAKYIVNSAYGKFGQDPERFKDWYIQIRGVHPWPGEEWSLEESATHWTLWSKPSPQKRYFDVAIAASVTSAARAVLMRGIVGATRPVYCDTDSIICRGLAGVELDEYALGAWKLEAEGDTAAIAGKKLYALFKDGVAVKWASKGTRLAASEIVKIARGGESLWQSDAPNFSLTGKHKFISRNVRKTA